MVKYENATISTVYIIHKQKCYRNRILETAKLLTNHHQTDHLRI